MLRSLALQNFKSFADESVDMAPFTLLVGANGSGKSNFLDALRFLHGLAHGWPIGDVVRGRDEGSVRVWDGIRGGKAELVRLGQTTMTLTSDWLIAGDQSRHTLTTDGAIIHRESMPGLFDATHDPTAGGLSIRWHTAAGANSSAEQWAEERGSALNSRSSFGPSQVRFELAHLAFVTPQPDSMREYVEKPTSPLSPGPTCRNLSGSLWQLAQTATTRAEILEWLVEFLDHEIVDFDFEETASGYLMLRIVDANGSRVTARSLSDGTLRFLGLLTHLKQRNGHLIVEEIESGLHPRRCRLLIEAIAQATQPRPADAPRDWRNVIATTHSADVVEAALQIPHAKVLFFSKSPAGSLIRDVRTLPKFEEVRNRRDFQYLLSSGWLERAV
jgi:energy-coupling factor transporter ATP-binding protein EcfA2